MSSKLPYPEGKPRFCQMERCKVKALYQMRVNYGYEGRWLSVCGTHDRYLGGKNLVAAGWSAAAADAWVRNPY